MRQRQDDQRTRNTRRLLKASLVSLMEQKDLREITVKELCTAAGVNRSTFYLHYYDIFDLMEEVEEEIGAELTQALENIPFNQGDGAFSAFCTTIFQILARRADVCEALLGEHGDKDFVGKLFALGREKSVAAWMAFYPRAGREKVEFYYTFVSSGCVGLLQRWLQTGCREQYEDVARQVERLVSTSIVTLEEN